MNKSVNSTDINFNNSCSGCGVCAVSCPFDAIEIKHDEYGFYKPFINEKCTNCGICSSICYKNASSKEENVYHFAKGQLYSMASKNADILKSSASGGMGAVLSQYAIQNGYKVVGVDYDYNKNLAIHTIADTKEECKVFAGSKYIQSYSVDAFLKAVKEKDQKYFVFGLPCQIYSLKKLVTLRKQQDRFVFVDLFCHGVPSNLVWQNYITDKKNSMGTDKISFVNFRSKHYGWGFCTMEMKTQNKTYYGRHDRDDFYTFFFSDTLLADSCEKCVTRKDVSCSDFRIGDFWGKRYAGDRKGTSAIVVFSEKGREILNKIEKEISIKEFPFSELKGTQNIWDDYKVNQELREKTFQKLKEQKGLKHAVPTLVGDLGIVSKIKGIQKYLPSAVIVFLKTLRK